MPVRSPSGVSGVPDRAGRVDERPYDDDDARLLASLSNLVGDLPRARAAAGRRDRGRSSARSRPAQVEPALVGLPRAEDAARRPHRDGEQPARERRGLGRTERARRAAGHRRATWPASTTASAPCSTCRASRPARGSRSASCTSSPRSSPPASTPLPVHLRERVRRSRCPTDLPPCDVDFVQLARVFQNLLENAMLYAGAGHCGSAPRTTNDGVRLWVEDQGPGIPADEHEAVFEKFFRGRRRAEGALRHGARPGDHARDRARPRRQHPGRRCGAARRAVRDHLLNDTAPDEPRRSTAPETRRR